METNEVEGNCGTDRYTEGYEVGMIDCAQMLAKVAADYSPKAVEDMAGRIIGMISEKRSERLIESTGMGDRLKAIAANVARLDGVVRISSTDDEDEMGSSNTTYEK
jgi:hypothetical protein